MMAIKRLRFNNESLSPVVIVKDNYTHNPHDGTVQCRAAESRSCIYYNSICAELTSRSIPVVVLQLRSFSYCAVYIVCAGLACAVLLRAPRSLPAVLRSNLQLIIRTARIIIHLHSSESADNFTATSTRSHSAPHITQDHQPKLYCILLNSHVGSNHLSA